MMRVWVLLGLFFSQAASAHTFGALDAGLSEGFMHPFLGLDHLLAMIAIGLWSVQLGRHTVYWAPFVFLTIMAGSASLAALGFNLPFLEPAIASTVLILGCFICFTIKMPFISSLSLIGLFAFFHGFAHGLELTETHSAALYGLGFLTASALLQGIGILIGQKLNWISKSTGFFIALTGFYLLAFN